MIQLVSSILLSQVLSVFFRLFIEFLLNDHLQLLSLPDLSRVLLWVANVFRRAIWKLRFSRHHWIHRTFISIGIRIINALILLPFVLKLYGLF